MLASVPVYDLLPTLLALGLIDSRPGLLLALDLVLDDLLLAPLLLNGQLGMFLMVDLLNGPRSWRRLLSTTACWVLCGQASRWPTVLV